MSKQRIIFILGIWVAVLPFMGFPESWNTIFYVFSGITLAYISYLMHREIKKTKIPKEKRTGTFVENNFNPEEVSGPEESIDFELKDIE